MAVPHWWEVAGGIGAGLGAASGMVGLLWKPYRSWLDGRIEKRFKIHAHPLVADVEQLKGEVASVTQTLTQHIAQDQLTRAYLTETLNRVNGSVEQMREETRETHDKVLKLGADMDWVKTTLRDQRDRIHTLVDQGTPVRGGQVVAEPAKARGAAEKDQ